MKTQSKKNSLNKANEKQRDLTPKKQDSNTSDTKNIDNTVFKINKKSLNPNIPLGLTAFFLVIDYFAFQKKLPSLVGYLLVVTPLSLLAITGFLWAIHKQFPFLNPFPHMDLMDEKGKVFHAIIFGIVFTF